MEHSPEKQTSKITYKNQPKLSGFGVDKTVDERRIALIPHIEHFLATDNLFKDKEVIVEFSHVGVSSLLCFLEVKDEKYVLKIPLRNPHLAQNEALFLKVWESVGVSVPHILENGKISDREYILMKYIDAPILSDAIIAGKIDKNVPFEIGKLLSRMHSPEAAGYGSIEGGKAEFETFREWILSGDVQNRINYVVEKKLLGDEHGSISQGVEILIKYAEKVNKSSYCHLDLCSQNIFATEPLTVFDPNPMLNNGIVDLARSILLSVIGGSAKEGEKMKEGYFSGNKNVEPQALQAAIILNAFMKFPYWHKKKKVKGMEKVRKYLSQTKHLLE